MPEANWRLRVRKQAEKGLRNARGRDRKHATRHGERIERARQPMRAEEKLIDIELALVVAFQVAHIEAEVPGKPTLVLSRHVELLRIEFVIEGEARFMSENGDSFGGRRAGGAYAP